MIGSERKLGGLDVHLGLELIGHRLLAAARPSSRCASTKTVAHT